MIGLRRSRESRSAADSQRRIIAPRDDSSKSTGRSGATERRAERMNALTSAIGTEGSMNAKSSRYVSSARPGETQASARLAHPSCQVKLSLSSSPLSYSSNSSLKVRAVLTAASTTPVRPSSLAGAGGRPMRVTGGDGGAERPPAGGEHPKRGDEGDAGRTSPRTNLSTVSGSGRVGSRAIARSDCELSTSTDNDPAEEEATMFAGS